MTERNWTNEQLQAISARNSNILIAAAAGAGKTAVLVERIIRRLLEKDSEGNYLDIDRFLVVTFTNAAAAEMRQRIADALAKKLTAACENPTIDKKLITHLERQLAIIGQASITTLHSFCLEIVRKYFYLIDLDPNFRIAGENEIELLKYEVIEDLFEKLYSEGNEKFLELVDAYGGERGDNALIELVLRLDSFSRSLPWPKRWLDGIADYYKNLNCENFNEQAWVKELFEMLKEELRNALEMLKKALEITNLPCGPKVYADTLKDDIAYLEILSGAKKYQQMSYLFANEEGFKNLPRVKKDSVDEVLKERCQSLRNRAKKCVQKIKEEYFSRSVEEMVSDLLAQGELVQALVELVTDFALAFQEAKVKKCLLDFNDLEHYCLKILLKESETAGVVNPSEIALNLRQHYTEVLVDEYQDINPLQELILCTVSRYDDHAPNLFMVGDVKQSIYRFRLTEPGLFLEKYNSYPLTEGNKNLRIDLAANFRSVNNVLDAVNFIFKQVMTEKVGEINYDEKAELKCGKKREEVFAPTVTLCLIERKNDVEVNSHSDITEIKEKNRTNERDNEAENDTENDTENESISAESDEELHTAVLEARYIAKEIKSLVANENNSSASLSYKDIVILMRSTKGWANIFLEEFRAAGIPAYAELGSGYFEAVEVETMLSLLQIIDNPRQDIHLAAVLRSPIAGLTADELAEIRLAEKKGDYFDALLRAAEDSADDIEKSFKLKMKINTFLDRLNKWRTMARQAPLTDLIWQIYRDTAYYDYVGGMPGGAQRQANLRALHDRALEYESTSLRGLFKFLRFIERLRDKGTDLGAARALGENEDVVRIMSIHKSKGLEFPVVFVAGTNKNFNFSDLKGRYLIHKKMGIGMDFADLRHSCYYETIVKRAIKQKILLETLAEEMRLLYVAMTRAKEKLLLVGTVKDIEKELLKWKPALEKNELTLPCQITSKARSYLHWLLPALLRHQDGEILRKILGVAQDNVPLLAEDASRFNIIVLQQEEIPDYSTQEVTDEVLTAVKNLKPLMSTGETFEKVSQWLSWKYGDEELTQKPAKLTVTEIKHRFDPLMRDGGDYEKRYQPIFTRPRFIQMQQGLTAAEQGTAMHLVMQHLPFKKNLKTEEINELLSELVAKEILSAEQANSIDAAKIERFLCSPLGVRILNAKTVLRECPFTLALKLSEIFNNLSGHAPGEEKIIVQGVIDCLFEENGGYILVDYKTDKVIAGSIEKIKSRYTGQLNLYANAAQTILNRPVYEKWLYLFDSGDCIKIE